MEYTLRPAAGDDELRACAEMMAASEPWRTLGRDAASVHRSISHPDKEVTVALAAGALRGCVVVNMHGVLAGYLQSVCVAEGWRGRGLGALLVGHAERRILREAPNVFLLVSAFNTRARALYERLGYTLVGELPDFVVRGQSELIMRKTIGPVG